MNHPLSVPDGTTWHDLTALSVLSLVAANLVPMFGVLFLGWSAGLIVVLYWYETAVIGSYSMLKMPFALRWFALFTIPFFIVHFGVFLWFTGGISRGLYAFIEGREATAPDLLDSVQNEIRLFTAVAMVSHGVSFVTNFIGKREYLRKPGDDVFMAAAYLRVLVMLGTVFVGGLVMAIFGAPAILMSVFVVLKIVVDLIAHLQEHARAAAPQPT